MDHAVSRPPTNVEEWRHSATPQYESVLTTAVYNTWLLARSMHDDAR